MTKIEDNKFVVFDDIKQEILWIVSDREHPNYCAVFYAPHLWKSR